MNVSLPSVLMLATGALLIYGAVKNLNPIQVVKDAITKPSATPDPNVAVPDNISPVQPLQPLNPGMGPGIQYPVN